MSFDIQFGVLVANTDKIIPFMEPDEAHPTYNISTMFRKAMDWNFKQGKWYKVSEVHEFIYGGYCELITQEYKYRKYNDPKGWGTTQTAIETLKSIIDKIDLIESCYELKWEDFYIRW